MSAVTRFRSRKALWLSRLALGLLLYFGNSFALMANSDSLLRAEVGLKLFHAMMLADQDADARADPNGILHVIMVYADDETQARNLAANLKRDITLIHGLQVKIRVMALEDFHRGNIDRPIGVFITQRLDDDELQRLVHISIRRRILLFSPFEGDVQRGVLGGLSVRTSVRPFINMRTLRRSGVRIRPFYLKVARRYEE